MSVDYVDTYCKKCGSKLVNVNFYFGYGQCPVHGNVSLGVGSLYNSTRK